GNALTSFTALGAGCATGASVSCCGAGRCSLTAGAATGGVGLARRLSATSLAVGPTWTAGGGGGGAGGGEGRRDPPKWGSRKGVVAGGGAGAGASANIAEEARKEETT